jgi:hypothetical protein
MTIPSAVLTLISPLVSPFRSTCWRPFLLRRTISPNLCRTVIRAAPRALRCLTWVRLRKPRLAPDVSRRLWTIMEGLLSRLGELLPSLPSSAISQPRPRTPPPCYLVNRSFMSTASSVPSVMRGSPPTPISFSFLMASPSVQIVHTNAASAISPSSTKPS